MSGLWSLPSHRTIRARSQHTVAMPHETALSRRFESGPGILGHRGAPLLAPDNTLAGFAACAALGADGVEFDVRRTADDVLVVVHDAVLPDGRIVRETPAGELPESIPLLADALEATSALFVNIEIKNHPADPDYDAEFGISVAVAALVSAFGVLDRVIVSSFDVNTIARLRQAEPAIALGMLTAGQADPRQLIARAESHRFEAIHPHEMLVDQAFVDRARAAGLAVFVWTVDDAERVRELAALGVDAIITNDPAAALTALGRRPGE